MSTRDDELSAAELNKRWADHHHAEMVRRRDAEARVADLEAGIRRLCTQMVKESGREIRPYWVSVRDLEALLADPARALVGDETPEGAT
ncbi:MAG TPA: hypothetical protein VMT27_07705 [Actinomycetes bacterium]|nr:hypothetical protein [Actinomycetes bacterium]